MSAPSGSRPPAVAGRGERPQARYWRRTLRLTGVLLLLWLLLSLAASYFAREIDFAFGGWRFSFWLGAQGALLAFLAIVVVYVVAMERLEKDARMQQEPADEPHESSRGESARRSPGRSDQRPQDTAPGGLPGGPAG